MNDLISRQAAIDALKRDEEYDEDIPNRADGVRDAIITISGMPSAQPYTTEEIQKIQELEQAELDKAFRLGREDALSEIVRCKDCKHVGTDATCCLVCNREGMGLRPFHVYHDDFCSYAERKGESNGNQP